MSGYPLLANRTGGYAIATASSRPWAKTTATTVTGKNKRAKAPPQIVHQLFANWSTLVDDPYWQAMFNNASLGKFPRGFSFQDNILTWKKGTKIHKLPLQGPDAEYAYNEAIEFFGRTAGLRSNLDQERIQQEQLERDSELNSIEGLTWSKIRRGRVKDILITAFVEDVAHSMKLDRQAKLQLRTVIGMGFILGYFGNDDVTMNNGKIQGITGIIYNSEKACFDFDPSLTPKSRPSKSKKDTDVETLNKEINFIALWSKYLKTLEKKHHSKLPKFQVVDQRGLHIVSTDNSELLTNATE